MKKIIVAFLALTILSGCSTTGQIVHLGFVAAQPNQGADAEDEEDEWFICLLTLILLNIFYT